MLRKRRKALVGRKITCNGCGHKTVKGAARVMRKLLFFFCPKCWHDRARCEATMRTVSAPRTKAEVAA